MVQNMVSIGRVYKKCECGEEKRERESERKERERDKGRESASNLKGKNI